MTDRELANAVIAAVDALNTAVDAAKAANIDTIMFMSNEGVLVLESVQKVSVTKFERVAR